MKELKPIIILSGFSGVGKDLLKDFLTKELDLNYICSYTSRKQRVGESEGNPYFFTTNEKIDKMNSEGKLIECREYTTTVNGVEEIWKYAISEDQISNEKVNIVVLDIKGTEDFIEHFGKESLIKIFVHIDDETRKQRAIKRGSFDETEWDRRLEDDKRIFEENKIREIFDYTLVNDDLETAKKQLLTFVNQRIINYFRKEQVQKIEIPISEEDIEDLVEMLKYSTTMSIELKDSNNNNIEIEFMSDDEYMQRNT